MTGVMMLIPFFFQGKLTEKTFVPKIIFISQMGLMPINGCFMNLLPSTHQQSDWSSLGAMIIHVPIHSLKYSHNQCIQVWKQTVNSLPAVLQISVPRDNTSSRHNHFLGLQEFQWSSFPGMVTTNKFVPFLHN